MPTIADVRKQYPQYDDLSDEQLADGFYKKFYSDLPREDFMAKLGIVAPARVGPEEINELPEPPTSSAGDAVARGVEQGASLGFSDEIGAAKETANKALGLERDISGPFSAIAMPVAGFVRSLLTDEGARDYDAAVESRRADIKTAETEHPGAFMAGNVGGALVTAPLMPAARVAQGAGVAGRALAAAKTGAGYGAAYGAGTGETAEERLEQGATGGLVGGATGGLASPAVDAVIAGGRALKNAVSPVIGALNPEKEAARRVVGALEADAGPGAADRAAKLIDEANSAGIPMTVADAGGDMTRALARSSANTSPAGREALQSGVADRFQNQAARFSDFIGEITGASGDTAALQQRVANVGRTVNKAAYSKAFKEGEVGAWDDELAALVQAPDVQEAIRATSRTGANKAVVDGAAPIRNPFKLSGDTMSLRRNAMAPEAYEAAKAKINTEMSTKRAQASSPKDRIAADAERAKRLNELDEEFATSAAKPEITPTLRFWDSVKRNLDDRIGTLQRAGEKSAAADAIALKDALVQKMDGMFPSYRDARRGAAAFFDAEDALEAGSKFASSPMANEEARRALGTMSEPEKELFRQGYANELLRRVNAMGDSKNVAGDAALFGSDRARERMDMVFGKPAARRVEALVSIEQAMNVTKRAVEGNSSTTRQLIEAGLAGGGAGFGLGALSGETGYGTMTGALLGIGMRRGYNLINGKVAERVGRLLASNNPNEVRKAVNMISRNPRLLAALRAGQEYIGRLSAPATGSTPVPAVISGRAEDEQQPEYGM